MSNVQSYNALIDRFHAFASGHFILKRFSHGQIEVSDLEKFGEYPFMHVVPSNVTYSKGMKTFSFQIVLADLPRDKEDKPEYQREVLSDLQRIAEDLVAEITNHRMLFGDLITVQNVSLEPFLEEFQHTLTGWTISLDLLVPYYWDACSIPAEWNDFVESGSGGTGSILTFIDSITRDNNGNVSLVNDEETPAPNYYYGTNGAGVRGWYLTTDNIGLTCETIGDCQTIIDIEAAIDALEEEILLKADITSISAVGFSNNYNDLDNLPTLPTGTVTSVGVTAGTGISVSGSPITSSGNITVTNSAPDQVVALTAGTGIGITGTYPNFTVTNSAPSSGGTVTAVTATAPISSSGGTAPNLSMTSANVTTNGYLLSSDWLIFNGKFNTPTGTTLQYLRGDGSLATFPAISSGTVTSVGLTMPSAFNVASSPITTSGTLAVTGAGTVSQYVRGDGSLANFPASTGGGGSLSYYLNGSVAQGTFGGVAFKEMDRTPVLGAGTDFTIATNGYIQSFITDANVPNQLEIPAGNWNFETYFSSSSAGGTPSFYIELYKWDGATLSLIASGSANPEGITNGTVTDLYVSAIAVPQTTLALTDRLAIRIYVNNSGRTIKLHTENSHLCEVITTFSTGMTALNGLTAQVQNFATGTAGTDFGISSVTNTHTFNLPTASAANRGALSSADWTTFNNKQAALVSGTNIKTINGATILGSGDLVVGGSTTLAVGTTPITSGTVGRILFEGTGNVLQESANLFWDNTNSRLGIGTATPATPLQINGNITIGSTSTLWRISTDVVGTGGNPGGYLNWMYNDNFIYYRQYNQSGFHNYETTGGSGYGHRWISQGTFSMTLTSGTRNLLIGTSTDAGFKFDVNGTGRIQGGLTCNPTSGFALTIDGGNGYIRWISSSIASYLRLTDTTMLVVDSSFVTKVFFNWAVGGTSCLNTPGNFIFGGTSADASSKVEITSTTQGFLPPRMTTTQKNAIATPASGLVVYDTTLGKLCVRGATAWETITSI